MPFRVSFAVEESFDPHAAPRRPVRTIDDYLREREARAHNGHDELISRFRIRVFDAPRNDSQ
jgi:hypothetical protein